MGQFGWSGEGESLTGVFSLENRRQRNRDGKNNQSFLEKCGSDWKEL